MILYWLHVKNKMGTQKKKHTVNQDSKNIYLKSTRLYYLNVCGDSQNLHFHQKLVILFILCNI